MCTWMSSTSSVAISLLNVVSPNDPVTPLSVPLMTRSSGVVTSFVSADSVQAAAAGASKSWAVCGVARRPPDHRPVQPRHLAKRVLQLMTQVEKRRLRGRAEDFGEQRVIDAAREDRAASANDDDADSAIRAALVERSAKLAHCLAV